MATATGTLATSNRYGREDGNKVFSGDVRLKRGRDIKAYFELSEDFCAPSGTTLPAWLAAQDTSAAGSPTIDYVDDATGGEYELTHDNQSEAQNIGLNGGDNLCLSTDKAPYIEVRAKLNTSGTTMTADQRVVIGLAAARNATLDDVATHAWFRIEGANWNILTEVDDASTDDDDNDSGLDWSDNSYAVFRVSVNAAGSAVFEVDLEDGNGWQAAGAPLDVSALVSSAVKWQPFIELQRDAGTETDSLVIDYVRCGHAVARSSTGI